jgi:hypothetical protein
MRPITFAPYDPMTDETNWEIGTEEKGTCYAVKRADTGGLICKLPYGLRSEEKALAQMFEKYDYIGFKTYYNQHFIQKKNTFTLPLWTPLASFCATLTMCKWH